MANRTHHHPNVVHTYGVWENGNPAHHHHTHTLTHIETDSRLGIRFACVCSYHWLCVGKRVSPASKRASEQRVILLLRYKWRRMRFKGVTLNFWLPPFFLSILPAMLRKCSLFFPFHSLRSKKFTVGICYHSLLLSFFSKSITCALDYEYFFVNFSLL